MNPPANDTGCKLPYTTMESSQWMKTINVNDFVGDGFVFIWVTNKLYFQTMLWMDQQGWEPVEHITWKKVDSKGEPLRRGGHYLWHSKETCLMFHRKVPLNKLDKWYVWQSDSDVITTEPKGLPSQKP